MSRGDTQSPDFNSLECGESTKSNTQKKIIFDYLQNHTVTASMLAESTNIPHKNICRYKRQLELQGLLCEVESKFCKLTGFRAKYLTTDPNLFPKKCDSLHLENQFNPTIKKL